MSSQDEIPTDPANPMYKLTYVKTDAEKRNAHQRERRRVALAILPFLHETGTGIIDDVKCSLAYADALMACTPCDD